MSNVSSYEDIRDRHDENAPQRPVFRPLDSLDPKTFDITDDTFARDVEAFRIRIENYALVKASAAENSPDVQKLIARNERSRREIEEVRTQITPENAERLNEKINFLERAIAENLHVIVDRILTPSQKDHVAAFERRLIDGRPIKNHCYSCKRDFIESADNCCFNCGRVKCGCGHCYCNFGFAPSVSKPAT
jgi:hypothetical protein